jgi:hypothetical protein
MLAQLRKSWRVFRGAPPGERFERLHESREAIGWKSYLPTIVGVLLLLGGIVLLFIPGPGLLLIAFGAGLVARQSLSLARMLDRLELQLRRLARNLRRLWKGASTGARAAFLAGCLICAGGVGYLGYLLLWKH